MNKSEALDYLNRDGGATFSRYGRHSEDCAPVAYALFEIMEQANGGPNDGDEEREALDYFMGLVVNEHNDVRSLIVEHGTADQIALIADTLTSEARQAGEERGRAASSSVIDGNTTRETAQRIFTGYEDGDPEIMDMQPAPLSGEMAGESIPELSEEYGLPLSDETVATAFEDGYSDGYWSTVCDDAAALIDDDEAREILSENNVPE